jgi:hypothetical protein
MKIPQTRFMHHDWGRQIVERHDGETGHAIWRSLEIGDLRIRRVTYSSGYLADHWCDRGHVMFVISGSIRTELKDGRIFYLGEGQSYVVSDFGDPAHRTSSEQGAELFIVD